MRKIHRISGMLCGGVLLGGAVALGLAGPTGAVTASAPPASAPASAADHPAAPFAAQWYQLYAPYLDGRKLCLDVPGGSATAGRQLQLFGCHASAAESGTQRWEFIPIGSTGHYHIRNTSTGLCIGLDAGEPFAGNAVTQRLCSVAPWWDVVPVNSYSPLVYIKQAYYNLALTADSAKDDKGYLIAEPIEGVGSNDAPDPAQVFQFSVQ